jgi:arginyl-tRNA synthetase
MRGVVNYASAFAGNALSIIAPMTSTGTEAGNSSHTGGSVAPGAGDVSSRLRAGLITAMRAAFPQLEGEPDPLVSPNKNPALGDFQCNAAMGLSKKLGKSPREVAAAIVASSRNAWLDGLIEPLTDGAIAGPGFINIRLATAGLAGQLEAFDTPALGVPAPVRAQRVVIDLMGVNLAKNMHVGHLRSPVIGDALARMLTRLGHSVVRQNHVGDWGLNIAMTTARVQQLVAKGELSLATLTLDDLDKAYAFSQRECQRDLAGLEAAKRWNMGPKAIAELEEQVHGATEAFTHARSTLLKLQVKDPATHAVWQRIYSVTMRACLDVCTLINVQLSDADTAGESSYADELAPMVEELQARGLAVQDAGALIVRLDNPPKDARGELLFEPISEPCLIRKTDGGYLYATTDVAACRRRVQKLGAERAIYAVDARQALHLRQVFAIAHLAGYSQLATAPHGRASFEHAAFGAILGSDGRPFKTRTGDSVKLSDLLQETFDRAGQVVQARAAERGTPYSASELATIGRAVGIAAIKYSDLSTDRVKDVLFNVDAMLAFEGDTGPYLLYALVRLKRIREKAGAGEGGTVQSERAAFVLEHASEKALALTLLKYPQSLKSAADALEPHRLCQMLYELAKACAVFYDQCPVIDAPPAQRASRLRLCGLAERVLEDGLACLGIPTLQRM